MRVYNGTNRQIDMPLSGGQRITIAPKSVSGDFMPNNDFLSLMVTSYDYSEIALIVSGPFEISMCSQISSCVGFVVNSLEEAIERFAEKEPATPEIKPVEELVKDEVKIEDEAKPSPVSEPEPEVTQEEKPEENVAVSEDAPKKKSKGQKKAE